MTERRMVPRFSFVAKAEVTAFRSSDHILAQISELSSKGCYLETPEVFPVGTELYLRIHHGGSKCDVAGKTIYKHEHLGMGVVFGEVPAEQRFILDGWLAELARKVHGVAPLH
jgi:PilZ domain